MLEVINLKKSFAKRAVLDGVNLKIHEGEIISVVGMSGTGKSVLLKSIIGLLEPDDGRIIFDNTDITEYSEQQYNRHVRPFMSMVFQEGALWDSMTVGENIDLALKIQKHLTKEERQKRIKESLQMVGLPPVEDEYPEELSGGMVKRVAIARAIATRPKYLLYDEPTTGLDPVLTTIIDELILKLNKELGTTSLVISHDISSVEKISDRVAMLHRGKIILECDVKDMWKQDDKTFNQFIRGEVIHT